MITSCNRTFLAKDGMELYAHAYIFWNPFYRRTTSVEQESSYVVLIFLSSLPFYFLVGVCGQATVAVQC